MKTLYPVPIDDFLRRGHANGEIFLRPFDVTYEDFIKAERDRLLSLEVRCQELFPLWLRIGWTNPWIAAAYDPPFTYRSLWVCKDLDDLTERICQGNWGLGIGFVLGELCFINQVNAGDEWLTIKGKTPIAPVTVDSPCTSTRENRSEFRQLVRRFQTRPETHFKALSYGQLYESGIP